MAKKLKKKRPERYWNYRLTVELVNDEKVYSIRELYYEDGEVISWTTETVAPLGSTKTVFLLDLDHYAAVVSHPIYDIDKRKWLQWPKRFRK